MHCHRFQVFCHLIRRYPRLCVFAYDYFVFLGRVTNPFPKPPFLVDQFVSLSLVSLLRPVRIGRPYQEQKVPAGIARNLIEARKPPPPPRQGGDNRGVVFVLYFILQNKLKKRRYGRGLFEAVWIAL